MLNMLHILTIHWNTDKWVDIQLRYLHTHLACEFKVYASLHNIEPSHANKFDYHTYDALESHAIKLNRLAETAIDNAASDDDWLMFLDGDAFPIGDLLTYGREKLSQYPLLAVQRIENNGDIQPHPCFCLTTVGFWKEIQGDWREGYEWKNNQEQHVTDVGGNLLHILEQRHLAWHPLRRTNKTNLLPTFFGIYDHIIYHHGAGFRDGTTRMHLLHVRDHLPGARWLKRSRIIPPAIHAYLNKVYDHCAAQKAAYEAQRTSGQVYRSIQTDPYFYRQFES